MNTDEFERSYLDMLRAELRQYEKNRQVAADKLVADGDCGEFYEKVIAGWDYDIAKLKTRIAQEEANTQ